jgi:hypothetical protein
VKRWFALVLLACLAQPALAIPEPMRLAARETLTLDYPGALAAFAVDASTVEVAVLGGQVVLHGRRAGQTLVTVVMAATVETLIVHVDPPVALALAFEDAARRSGGFWDASYDTGTHRFTSGLSAKLGEGDRTVRLRFEAVHEGAQPGGRGVTALPVASIEIESPGRSVVLLDQLVHASPLTIDGVVLRGAHLHQDGLDVHAGIASATPFEDLLIPGSGDRALGVSARIGRGPVRLVPSLLWLPDSGTSTPGVVSLGVEGGTDREALQFRGELGWGGRPGASLDVNYHDAQRQAWLKGVARPAGFAALRLARPAGSYLDGAWSEQLGERTTAGLSASANRLDLPGSLHPAAASARLDLRHELTKQWSLTGAVGAGTFRNSETQFLRRSTVSLGTAYDAPGFGVAALYRYQQTSAANRGGHGGRVSLRGSTGGWRGNLFVDAQQQAPTLDLVLQDRSDLARALAELGIAANNPEDVIRLLRDNAALLTARGVSIGPLRVDPLRVQSGLDVSWRGSGARSLEFGLRLIADEAQAVASERRAFVGTLYANWHVAAATDISVSYSRWSVRRDRFANDDRGSFQLSLRTSFSTLAMPGEGSLPITGQIVRDDDATGATQAGRPPLPGIEVMLDRSRRTRTDSDGRFVFERPGAGAHRVEAVLPPQPGAYFTEPSVQTLPTGADGHFAITFSGARLAGTVRSDAGLPMAGVTVRVEGLTHTTTITDSSGAYRFAGPAGEVRVVLALESLPPGYELGEDQSHTRHLAISAPAVADFTVRAQRGVEGMVIGPGAQGISILALEAARTVRADASGRFVLRGLPAGPQTLVVTGARGEIRSVVDVPAEPGLLKGIRIQAP